MILVNEIKGIMRSKEITQRELAEKLGISQKTLYSRFNKGIFGSDEIEIMIEFLEISKPLDIFFVKKVT